MVGQEATMLAEMAVVAARRADLGACMAAMASEFWEDLLVAGTVKCHSWSPCPKAWCSVQAETPASGESRLQH